MISQFRRIRDGAIRRFVARLPESMAKLLFDSSMARLSSVGGEFLSIRKRPKRGDEFPYRLADFVSHAPGVKIGIILQGPLWRPDDFTVETVRYYRAVCPDAAIVLSTWEGESPRELEKCRRLGAEIVVSSKPPVAGRSNVNFQLISTAAGIRNLAARGCVFVAKTRTDQRFYAIHHLHGLPTALKLFPSRNADGQKMRLVATTLTTAKCSPLRLSDFFMFGTLGDMAAYWDDAESDSISLGRPELDALADIATTVRTHSELAPERYLLTRYLRRSEGEEPEFTLYKWWSVLADRFFLIDWSQLDGYWPKYMSGDERPDVTFNSSRLVDTPISTLDWLACLFDVPPSDGARAAWLDRLPNSVPPLHMDRST